MCLNAWNGQVAMVCLELMMNHMIVIFYQIIRFHLQDESLTVTLLNLLCDIVDIKVPQDYPVHPPRVIMTTPIDHANINSKGNFSLHSLMTMSHEWNSQKTQIRDILNEIIELLYCPVSKKELFERHNKGRSDIATI